MKYFITVK